ncbi:MAG: hypothetical protein BWK79_17505 [Beggiatoa sp. IS2]|nr:MAG: hypothetical protein BWK79_17505 [Beggiatoa sp. IS2]
MENTLKRLLAAEVQAEELVSLANAEREQLIALTLQEVQQAELAFKSKIPELRANLLEKAEAHAAQTVAELNKRYESKKASLRLLAEDNRVKAVTIATDFLLRVGLPS